MELAKAAPGSPWRLWVLVLTIADAALASAQATTRVDFAGDVQPLFQQHCVECHGPSQQMAGMRLDQRSSAMKIRSSRLRPGSSATSRLYLRLANSDYGPQMPPAGALAPNQIQMVKDWIDQGADWPDALAGDPPAPPPPDPVATRIMDALRRGDRQAFERLLGTPQVGNSKGPGGSTPLMYAVLYGDLRSVRRLLENGADPNLANHAGATALMWAVGDAEKTKLLLEHGANANARAEQGLTPLAIAANRSGSSPVVKLLLDHGAHASAGPGGEGVLRQAANAGDAAVFRMLVERDAPLNAPRALVMALRSGCSACVDALIDSVDKHGLNTALVMLAPFGDANIVKKLLDHGADVDATLSAGRLDMKNRTPLLLAASSDFIPTDAVKLLIERGADLGARGPAGETALDLAKRNGDTAVVELLMKSGAKETGAFPTAVTTPQPALSARAALARSIPLLQKGDVTFTEKAGCVSCHNNSFTAMTIAAVRAHRLPLDEQVARAQRERIAALLDAQRDDALLGGMIENANALVGLAAERHPPDATTDAMAYLIKGRQLADGRWRAFFVDHRPPIQASDIEMTAMSMRALRVYAPKTQRAEYERVIRRGSAWLTTTSPRTTDEYALKLLGLTWAGVGTKTAVVASTARALLASQRSDGGWAQLPTLASDAYATGQVLVALNEAGALRVTDPSYQRGVRFLLSTQLADGSWYVKTRSIPFQPYFESGFPHGPDQWISMAATDWASMALAPVAR